MLASSIAVWSGPQVAEHFGLNTETVRKIANRHNIGIKPVGHRMYELYDVHCLVWRLKHPNYKGPMPWTLPEAPPPKRRKLYNTREAEKLAGMAPGSMSGIRMRTNVIGQAIGRDVVYTPADIKKLKRIRANPRKLHPEDGMIRDPKPREIKLDINVIRLYDGLVEEYMPKKPGNAGRTKNLVSVYLSDDIAVWMEERRLRKPYLAKSQAILEALQELREREEREENDGR